MPTFARSSKNQENSRKTCSSSLLTMPKPLILWTTINCENSERDGNIKPLDLPLEKPICRSESNSQNWTCNNRLVPNRKRSMSRLLPCLFNFYAEYIMRNTGLEEAQAGIKIARRNINNFIYADDTTLMAESEEQLKSLLMKVKEERWLKSQHSENEHHGIWFHHFMGNIWGNSGNTGRVDFGGLQNHCGR